nr:LysR substrate-binding domain-containing protein [Burkholderia ambifaria]
MAQSDCWRPSFVFRSNDLAALLHAARAGLGIAALPCFLAAHDPAVCLLSDHPCSTARQLWLVMHPDVKRSPRVRLVADLLAKLVGAPPPGVIARRYQQ